MVAPAEDFSPVSTVRYYFYRWRDDGLLAEIRHANLDHSTSSTATRYRVVWLKAAPFGNLGDIWGEQHRQSAVTSRATVGGGPIVPPVPISPLAAPNHTN